MLCFYQNETIKDQTSVSSDSTNENIPSSNDIVDCLIEGGDIDEIMFVDLSKKKVKDIPVCAREVLKGLNNCKDIVRYVKLVS